MRSGLNVGLMLGQRLRRWSNIKPTLSSRACACWDYNSRDEMVVHVTAKKAQLRPFHRWNLVITFSKMQSAIIL